MINKLVYLFRSMYKMIKYRKVLFNQMEDAIRKKVYQAPFVRSFGYWPEGLEYNDASILKLSPTSRVGKHNKLVLSKTKFPCSDGPTMIFLGQECWTGQNVEINILPGTKVIIKNYSTIQDNCKLIGDITIEKYCLFAPAVFISSGNHYALKDNPDLIRNQDEEHLNNEHSLRLHSKGVHIEEDCWIGNATFIRQGVYIGRGVVIGANSVVTKDVLPYSIIGGINKLLNERFVFKPPTLIQASVAAHAPYFYRGFAQKKGEYKTNIDGHFILEPGTGIIFLKKGEWASFFVSGTVLQRKAGEAVLLTILFNGQKQHVTTIDCKAENKFLIQLNEADFQPALMPAKDPVWRFANNYNIFQLSYSVQCLPEENDKCTLLAFDFFEEKTIEY